VGEKAAAAEQAWTDPAEPCGGMPRVSRGGLDAAAAEAQRRRAATRRSLMPARATEKGQEQRIGGGFARAWGVLQTRPPPPIRERGTRCRRRVCVVCTLYSTPTVEYRRSIYLFVYCVFANLFHASKINGSHCCFLAFLCEKALYIAYHYS